MKPEIPIDQPPKVETSRSDAHRRQCGERPLPFRFSLRTLIVVMLLLSLASIWPAFRVYQARRAQERREWRKQRVAAIAAPWREFGPVDVWLDKDGNALSLNLQHSEGNDEGLKHIEELTSLREVEFQHCRKFTDAGLEHLSGMTNLQNLGLNHTRVTDAGLEHVGSISSLRVLGLWGTQVTDAGLEHLTELTNLRLLYLVDTQVTENGVERLQQVLPNCRITHQQRSLIEPRPVEQQAEGD